MWMKHYKLNEHEQKLVDMSVKEFDDYMMSNYANMFKQRNAQEGQKIIHPMNFGFAIGPGWRHVLDSLCSKLKIIQDLTGHVCVFDQVKEKYGGARFYTHVERIGHVEKNEADDKKSSIICDTIDSLVSMYEEYCDYVCEELGINISPEEKIIVGGWYYGMGIDGFKKTAKIIWKESSDDRIALAEKYLSRKSKEKKITGRFYDLNDDELEEINKTTTKMIERKRNENSSH